MLRRRSYIQANSTGVPYRLIPAEPDDTRDCCCREDFHHRVVHGVGHDRVLEGVHVGAVDLLETLVGFPLAIKEL